MFSRKLRGPSLFFSLFFCQLRGHPCCAGWMVVNHFESDVSITVPPFLPPPSRPLCINEASDAYEPHSQILFETKRASSEIMASDLLAASSIFSP